MSRLPIPTIDESPAATRPLLAAIQRQLGAVPNLMKVLGHSAAALEGYLALNGALAKGAIDAATRERIALAVADYNGCEYCLAAHTDLGRTFARLDDADIVVDVALNVLTNYVNSVAQTDVDFPLARRHAA